MTPRHERFPPGQGDQQQHLMHSYDVEGNGLSELAEDSDEEEDDSGSGLKRTSFEDNNNNGSRRNTPNGESNSYGQPRRAQTRTSETELVQLGGQKASDQVKR